MLIVNFFVAQKFRLARDMFGPQVRHNPLQKPLGLIRKIAKQHTYAQADAKFAAITAAESIDGVNTALGRGNAVSSAMDATSDYDTLTRLVQKLREAHPLSLPYKKRATVAIILRLRGGSLENWRHDMARSPSPNAPVDLFLNTKYARESSLEALYIKRAGRDNDPWSGQVAFPGGRRQKEDATDIDTAVRETREEVGIDLNSSCDTHPNFAMIGRLDDRQVYSGGKAQKDYALGAVVFLQLVPHTPPITLEPSEVASACWTPFSFLKWDNVQYGVIKRPYVLMSLQQRLGPRLCWLMGLDLVDFPSLPLHKSARTDITRAGGIDQDLEMTLWGMTLNLTSELGETIGLQPLNVPIHFNSVLVNSAIAVYWRVSAWLTKLRMHE